MREIRNVFEARNYLLNTYGGKILEKYTDKTNDNYKDRTVGFLYVKNGTVFFMRFRRNSISFNKHYPNFEMGGIGFGSNRSEIEKQIYGLRLKNGTICRQIWTMIVRPDNKVYVATPFEIKEFVRRFNTSKSYFMTEVPDEDEDILNVPFRLFFNFKKWLSGEQTHSDFDWQAIRNLTQEQLIDIGREGHNLTLTGIAW